MRVLSLFSGVGGMDRGVEGDWTRWAADGTEIADSHRYGMCGNGVVAPVAEWIARRLPDAQRPRP